MNTMEIPEGQDDLIRTWYQELPGNPDEYLIMLRFSVVFNQFCIDSSNDVDFNKYLSDFRKQSIVDLSFNKASILHPNLFRMTYEALKHHEFDRHPHPPANSRLSSRVTCIIYPGNKFKAERELAFALILQHHSKNPGAPSSDAASTQQPGPSSVARTSEFKFFIPSSLSYFHRNRSSSDIQHSGYIYIASILARSLVE